MSTDFDTDNTLLMMQLGKGGGTEVFTTAAQTGKDWYCVYFPVESKINEMFLAETNSYSDKEMNIDSDKKGYFGRKGRVKATRLRGEKSMGYIVPIQTVVKWAGYEYGTAVDVGTEFDTINGIKLVEKYVVKTKGEPRVKQGKKPALSRLVDGQVHLHVDTENLRRNAHKINPDDVISITYKTHGTSWWVGNVIVKRKLKFWEKVGKFLGFDISDLKYDLVYGSRRVVKNKAFEDPKGQDHYFGYDLWEGIKDEIGHKIPKGYTLYGEMIGYDANGRAIQKGYDYGCQIGATQHKLEVYRITYVNYDGEVQELSYPQIAEFCKKYDLTPAHLYYYGTAMDWLVHNLDLSDVEALDDRNFQEYFVPTLEKVFNEKDCWMCENKVPEEGIIVRKDNLYSCESYKLKSFRFLEWESKELDKGIVDVESEN